MKILLKLMIIPYFLKNNYNILEQITQMKNNNTNYNTEYTDKNYDLEKVKKIQENYRLYKIRNKFKKCKTFNRKRQQII